MNVRFVISTITAGAIACCVAVNLTAQTPAGKVPAQGVETTAAKAPQRNDSAPRPATTVVVLPAEDFAGAGDGARVISDEIATMLTAKGWNVVPTEQVEKLLEAERVRYLDSLDAGVRTRIAASTGATTFVSSAVLTFTEGRNPVVAAAARMVRLDGTLAWGDVAGISADDTEAILGFGRKTKAADVARDVVVRLLKRVPAPGEESVVASGEGKRLFRSGPEFFRSADLDPSTPHRVCILPFNNLSPATEASRVVAEIIAIRLAAASGFEVVEAATLRSAALNAKIGSFRWIASEHLTRLAAAVGTPLFLQGTIYEYAEADRSRSSTPQVDVELSLIDVSSGRVLWGAQHDRRGSDYTGFLMLGTINGAASLADRVIAEIVQTGTRGKATPSAAAKMARKRQSKPPERRSALGKATNGENP